MEIIAKTIYDEKVLKTFIRFSLHKGKYYKLKRMSGMIFFLIVLLIFLLSLFLNADAIVHDPMTFKLFIVFFSAILVLWIFIYVTIPGISFNKSKHLLGVENQYVFHDAGFEMTSENPHFQGNSRMQYSLLFKVYETRDFFYLFIDNMQAYVVDKSQITNGSVEDLGELLSKHLPQNKYIICNDRRL